MMNHRCFICPCAFVLVILAQACCPPAHGGEPLAQQKYVTNSIGMKLVRIPAGEFLMGSSATDKGAAEDEQPQHRVKITQPFYMGVFEVTQEEYRKVTGISQSFFSPTGGGRNRVKGMDTRRFPVEQMRWFDAVEFCRKLSGMPAEKKAGRVYRLPTEAEWEYACRAGTKTAFCYGDSLSSQQATFNGDYPFGGAAKGPFRVRTTKVGSYAPNAWGLYDMHGNVWEWCRDWYGRSYYKNSPAKDPLGPKEGTVRVIRGGGWYADGADCRSAFRYADVPDGVFYVMGFRVVMVRAGSPNEFPLKLLKENKRVKTVLASRKNNPATKQGEDWPCWRGPRGDGAWNGPKLPAKFPKSGLRTIWRQPIGGGYGGVVVSKRRVFTLDYLDEPAAIERVLCFDAATGQRLWSHNYPVSYKGLQYGNGPRASPTVHNGRVYALGAVGHLHCLDAATGKVLWQIDLVKKHRARKPGWGFSASPIIFENLVIVHAGAEPNGCFVAFDENTGKEVWRNLPDQAGYSTPIVLHHKDQPQLACWTPSRVCSLNPSNGKLNWSFPFVVTYGTSIASPIFHDGIVFVSGYYDGSKAIKLGDRPTNAKILWTDRRHLRGLMSTPLYRKGHTYLLDKRLGVTCFNMNSGKKLWDDGNRMTPKGRNPQISLVWTGNEDHVLALNSEGYLVHARFNPQAYQELSRTKIIGPTWAHPAFAGHCVYARSDEELVCVALTGNSK